MVYKAFRFDDIQFLTELMIYNASHWLVCERRLWRMQRAGVGAAVEILRLSRRSNFRAPQGTLQTRWENKTSTRFHLESGAILLRVLWYHLFGSQGRHKFFPTQNYRIFWPCFYNSCRWFDIGFLCVWRVHSGLCCFLLEFCPNIFLSYIHPITIF